MIKHQCPICGTEISVHQSFLPGHCGARDCAREAAIAGEAERQAEKKAYYREGMEIARRERAAELAEISDTLSLPPDQIAVGVVPHRVTPLEPLTPAERRAYLSHLQSLIDEAFEREEPQPQYARDQSSEAEEPYPWNNLACTACEGHCCAQGGGETFAFHTTDLIHHLRINRPDIGPEEIREHYEDALPDQHIENACLFQGPQGCTLTRDWRADICNTFRCYELRQLAEQMDPSKHKALAMFSIRQRTTHRMTVYATNETLGDEG